MRNCNTLNDYLKDDSVDFVKNIINGLGKADIHFMCDMLLEF